jgi:hypothetical protein
MLIAPLDAAEGINPVAAAVDANRAEDAAIRQNIVMQ